MLAFFLLAGCASSPKTSQADVVRIARDVASAAGYKLADFREPKPYYEMTWKDQTWVVFFEMKPPTPPGGAFLVWVNDKTGETRVVAGE